jgi:serine/threonine-protein kinase
MDLRDQLQAALAEQYTIERELPRGGMSRVFAANEMALGRTVVIKVLSPELAASLSTERFEREIRLAARLQHPSIVPLLNAGSAVDTLYFTMPLIDGESLRERMSRTRPMPIDDVVRITEDIAGALYYAHAEGVVHRDIKPENIMFFHDRAVVLDFGIGKALTAATTESGEHARRITQTGMSLGTPIYVSPEQAIADPALDHRADIYSFGVVVYEMLCGHPPFSAKTPQAMFAAHANQAPPPIQQRRTDTPPALAAIVMRCLAKHPAERPQTGQEIIRAIRGTPTYGTLVPLGALSPARLPVWVPWAIAGASICVAAGLAWRLAKGP